MQLALGTSKWRTQLAIQIGALVLVLYNPMGVAAQAAPSLGSAQRFAVLGGSTVTNTGPSIINGDVGVSPGTAVTGFPPAVITGGAIHAADAVALQGQNDVVTAYNALAAQACAVNLTGQNLGGMTLVPGTYCFPSTSAQLTGTLTLDAQGNNNAVFIFQVGSTLTTASNSTVREINSGNHCNVFWQIGSSATLGTGTTFVGNILALTSIALNTATSVSGRALARNGAVTLDTNTVSFAACGQPVATPVPPTPTATTMPSTPASTSVPATPTATVVPSRQPPSSGGGGGHSPAATSVPQAAAPAPPGASGGPGTPSGTGGTVSSGAPVAPAAASAPPAEAAAPGAPAAAEAPLAPAAPAAPQVSTAAAAPPAAPEASTAPAPEAVPVPAMLDTSTAPVAPEAADVDSIQRLIQPAPVTSIDESLLARPALPSSLPNTGDPFGSTIVWLTWAGAAATLVGFSLLVAASFRRRRYTHRIADDENQGTYADRPTQHSILRG